MTGILNRYVLRETAQTWLAVTGVLLLILVTNQFARVLEQAAGAKLPKDALLQVMGFSTLQYLTILIPVGLFLAIMIALGRLYRDSEMAAIMACGRGPVSLYRPLIGFGLLLAAIAAWLALLVGPESIRQMELIRQQARQRSDLGVLEPGRFISFADDSAVIYAQGVTQSGRLQNVFVQRQVGDSVQVIVADEADQVSDEILGVKILTFYRGRRYEGVPGEPDFRVISFAEHGIPYSVSQPDVLDLEAEALSTGELLGMSDPLAAAELQWRISVPITVLILVFLAVPLSRTEPRQGRYSNLVAGVLLYLIYANLLAAAKVWVEQGKVPAVVGVWWVHGLFLLLAIVLLMRQYGLFARMLRWRWTTA